MDPNEAFVRTLAEILQIPGARTDPLEGVARRSLGFLRVILSRHRLGLNPDEMEDLVQDFFLTIWRLYPEYDQSRGGCAWLDRIAFNCARTFRRRTFTRRGRERTNASAETFTGTTFHDEEADDWIVPREVKGRDELAELTIDGWKQLFPHCEPHWVAEQKRAMECAEDAARRGRDQQVKEFVKRAAMCATLISWAAAPTGTRPQQLAVYLAREYRGAKALDFKEERIDADNVYQIRRRFKMAVRTESALLSRTLPSPPYDA